MDNNEMNLNQNPAVQSVNNLGQGIPVQPSPAVNPTPVASVQPSPAVNSTPVAPVQPSPAVNPTPVAPVQPIPAVNPTPVAPVQPSPAVNPTSVAPVQSGSEVTSSAQQEILKGVEASTPTPMNDQLLKLEDTLTKNNLKEQIQKADSQEDTRSDKKAFTFIATIFILLGLLIILLPMIVKVF